jgi:hypothetical protein
MKEVAGHGNYFSVKDRIGLPQSFKAKLVMLAVSA